MYRGFTIYSSGGKDFNYVDIRMVVEEEEEEGVQSPKKSIPSSILLPLPSPTSLHSYYWLYLHLAGLGIY